MTALTSIIMPAYNAELWIAEAIEGVLNQTYTNWELVIINDGSTDNTEIICMEYVQKDKRIRLISQDNHGPSAARNYGLKNICGDYFTIIDCDDRLCSDALEQYLLCAEKSQADTVIAGYKMVNLLSEKSSVFCAKNGSIFEICKNINIAAVEQLLTSGLMASNWNKLYRNNLKLLRFDEKLSLNEDVLFSLTALYHSRCVAILPEVLYEYRVHRLYI